MTKYIFRLDDISPYCNWERYHQLEALFQSYGVQPLLGVIPDNQDPELLKQPLAHFDFWEHIRQKQKNGWSIALHGYQHLFHTQDSGLLQIQPRSEFAGLCFEKQCEQLKKGLSLFSQQDITADAFMAPAHSFDETTLRALKEVQLTVISDGYGLYPFSHQDILFIPQLTATPRAFPLGIHTFCLHPNHLSDPQIRNIEAFLKIHHKKIISFKEAHKQTKNSRTQKFSRKIIKKLFLIKRNLQNLKIINI